MKLLIDMNLSPLWVKFFDNHSIESVHWSAIGDPRARDSEIFEFARLHGYIIFTNDLDFGAILAITQAQSPSVIQLKSQELLPEYVGNDLLNCLIGHRDYLLNGCLLSYEIDKFRIRILPIAR